MGRSASKEEECVGSHMIRIPDAGGGGGSKWALLGALVHFKWSSCDSAQFELRLMP